jgi:metallophosphoesterase superfamily enzyme
MILGDIKHAVQKVPLEEWRDVPLFFQKVSEKVSDIHVIPGNHDGNLEALVTPNVKIHDSSGIVLWKEVGLIHGHAWPSRAVAQAERLIMAHLHPVVTFSDPLGFRMPKQVWVKTRYNKGSLQRAILNRSNNKTTGKHKPESQNQFGSTTGQCVILPSFNEFLGGRSVNRPFPSEKRTYVGPILRSSAVDFENAELYLLDGTLLGTIKQLRMSS